MMRKRQRTVVVTGAGAGVGRATVRAFGARGDKVALLSRGDRGLERAAWEIRDGGGEALPLTVDVADGDAVEAAAARVEEELGPIDVWVNNAFTTAFGPFSEIDADEFHRVTEVTYLGYVHGTHAALRRMRPRDRGTIVQVGSALAYRGIPLQAAYCGAKHAIQGFTEAVRCELMHERSRVRLTMVQLPAVNTPQFDWALNRMPNRPQPVPPIYQPEVAADHPRRREYWVASSTVGALLANRLAPGLMDRYLARTCYGSQQTGAESPPGAPHNLWEPLDDRDGVDFGAHGRFDDRAKSCSPLASLSRHRGAIGVLAGGAIAAVWHIARTARRP